MKLTVSLFIFLFALAAPTYGKEDKLPEDAATALRTATNAILYSLEPWAQPAAKDNTFHRYKLLGHTTLDAEQTQTAVAAFEAAIAPGGDVAASCFDPRHALRVQANGQTYDFLLCYACHWLSVIKDDKRIVRLVASGGSSKELNKLLTAAGIPLSRSK